MVKPRTPHRRPGRRRQGAPVTGPPSLTLAEFDRQLDQHAGEKVGFATAVDQLAQTRARLAALKERRLAVYEQVKRRYAGGTTLTGDGRWELREVTRATRVVRTVVAADAKAADSAAWAASRVAVRRVAVSTPGDWRPPAVPPMPMVPRGVDPIDRVVGAYKHQAFTAIASEAAREAVLIGRLVAIADAHGWDGLPIAFADGWSVGLATLRFDADQLAVVAPRLYEALAIDVVRGGQRQVLVVPVGADADDQGDGYAE